MYEIAVRELHYEIVDDKSTTEIARLWRL